MASQEEVRIFLQGFKAKMMIFNVLFRDERKKNTQALLDMEITPAKRKEIIESIEVEDYSAGPLDDKLYGVSSMWVFGKYNKELEIYIKISVGITNNPVLCISFHPAEHDMNYPFKMHKK